MAHDLVFAAFGPLVLIAGAFAPSWFDAVLRSVLLSWAGLAALLYLTGQPERFAEALMSTYSLGFSFAFIAFASTAYGLRLLMSAGLRRLRR